MVDQLAQHTGTAAACVLLGRSWAGHYRDKTPRPVREPGRALAPSNALSPAERAQVLATLTSHRFADKSVAQIWATLLEPGPSRHDGGISQ